MFSSTSPWIDCCKDCCLAHGRGWEKIGPQRGAFIVVSMGNFRHWRSRAKSSRSHFSLWSHWIIFWWKWRSRWGKDRARVNIFLKIPIAIFFPRTIPEPSSSGLEHLVSEMKAFEKEQRFFFHFIFWSITIIVVRGKSWKPVKTAAMSFQHLLPAWTKFRVSYHYHNCFVWLWVGIFKSTSSSSSPSSIDLNWTFKHKKNWFLIVYFQCIRKYKDYTFDYDDMAV